MQRDKYAFSSLQGILKPMEEEKKSCCPRYRGNADSGLLYILGVIGGAVYYLQQAETFWIGVLGLLKAFIWPAMLVYELFGFLEM